MLGCGRRKLALPLAVDLKRLGSSESEGCGDARPLRIAGDHGLDAGARSPRRRRRSHSVGQRRRADASCGGDDGSPANLRRPRPARGFRVHADRRTPRLPEPRERINPELPASGSAGFGFSTGFLSDRGAVNFISLKTDASIDGEASHRRRPMMEDDMPDVLHVSAALMAVLGLFLWLWSGGIRVPEAAANVSPAARRKRQIGRVAIFAAVISALLQAAGTQAPSTKLADVQLWASAAPTMPAGPARPS